MQNAGSALRAMREARGLSYREVEAATAKISEQHGRDEYLIPTSRLFEIENKNTTPSMYRLYSLAVVYREDFRNLIALFGLDLSDYAADLSVVMPRNTGLIDGLEAAPTVFMPTSLDPGFKLEETCELGRMILEWGTVSLQFLKKFQESKYHYGYIGRDDYTLYPLITPGSLVLIDPSRDRVESGPWCNESERPVYFVETRTGNVCCWCEQRDNTLLLQSHPLSGVAVRTLPWPQGADVIGQVIAVAKRLGGSIGEIRRQQRDTHTTMQSAADNT